MLLPTRPIDGNRFRAAQINFTPINKRLIVDEFRGGKYVSIRDRVKKGLAARRLTVGSQRPSNALILAPTPVDSVAATGSG